MKKKMLIYGATGYTGKLIAREAKARGMTPVLAGRSEGKVMTIAAELGLHYRVFGLDDPAIIDGSIRDMDVVLNCAGPFSSTAVPMVEACLRTGTHYLDLAGEMDDFETMAKYDTTAKKKKIMILPGIGFDVVPSDCLALYVSKKVRAPRALYLCISGLTAMSRGTMKTAIEGLTKGIRVRRNGSITKAGRLKTREADFGSGKTRCISLPWGDVAMAYYTTGIGTIEEYFRLTPKTLMYACLIHYFSWLYGAAFMRKMMNSLADKQPEGPSGERRESERSVFVATAEGADGTTASARLVTPEGYKLTCLTALNIAGKVLKGTIKTGFMTPAQVFGPDLIMEIKGVTREDLKF
jgi:short subunit dehydrogenase-like uncharacterized protein